MKFENDTQYFLTSLSNNEVQSRNEFQFIKGTIERDGYFIVNSVKVYRAELVYLFTNEKIIATNIETQTKEQIRNYDYLLSYIEGYKQGEQYFETDIKVSPNTLYGANAEQYVRDIHMNFFHIRHVGMREGWGYVKKGYPCLITHKVIKEFGYYSGIVSKVEEQVKEHPRLFATFDKCEHSLPPQQTETKTDKLKVKQIALIHVYEGIQITRENAGGIAAKYGYTAKNSGEGLFQDYITYCSMANRKGKPTPCTQKRLQNKIELFESVVKHLSDNKKQKAIDEINILKTIVENEYQ